MTVGPAFSPEVDASFLLGGGEMGERMRAADWSLTALGPPPEWPPSLKVAARMMLVSQQPMCIWWGADRLNLYNDAFRPLLGGKHPGAFGQAAAKVWPDIWDHVAARVAIAMQRNEGTADGALRVMVGRNGSREETYQTFSYNPIPDDHGGVAGVLCACSDDTRRIVGERQVRLLRALSAHAVDSPTPAEACALTIRSLERDPLDLPFALIYLVDPDRRHARLAGSCGLPGGHPAAPESMDLDGSPAWPWVEALRMGQPGLVGHLDTRFGALPTGTWPEPPHQAVVAPIPSADVAGPAGVLIAGLSPFRPFDDSYRGFIAMVAAQIAAGIAGAQAREALSEAVGSREALRESERGFREMADALKEADRRKDEFLATLAHELRNPLAPISYGLHVMGLAEHDPDTVKRVREMMERQVRQMVRLIDDLLDVSRISRGQIELRRERVDLGSVALNALDTSRPLIQAFGHERIVAMPPEPVFVDVDVTRLAQAISNLLNNAAKYTPRGGHIRLAVELAGAGAIVSVKDDGIGIPRRMLSQVFDLFTQVDPSLEKAQGGLGIGLTIVKRLIDMHGGTVEARSDGPAMGSQFFIRLPSMPAPAAALHATGAGGSGAGATARRILIVDDNHDSVLALSMMLRMMGHDARTAHDGVQALEAAAALQPELVLLDIGMPRLNGYDTCRQLRAQPWANGMVIVALTGWGQDEDRRRSREAGFDHHLVKPVDRAALATLLSVLH